MLRTLFFTLLSFVVQLNAFADTPLQQCRQLYSQQDSKAAFETCLPLAEQGSGEASFILSNLYTQGIGDKQPDLQQALVWLLESAKQGHAPACFNLAALYERGKVVDQDYALAYSWYERGAQRGHTGSQFKVGVMSLKGIGTEKNAKKAQAWLGKAAESGNQNAQVTLAILLSDSDAQKSFEWYNRAADQGNPLAYSQLAEAYAEGKLGQQVDLNEALYLAQKSVILGRANSQVLVDRIRQKINSNAPVDLTPTQLAVSETANPDASLADTDDTVEAVNETATAVVIKDEKTAPENSGPETVIPETATIKTTAPKTAMANTAGAEDIDTEAASSALATPEAKTVADPRSEVASSEAVVTEETAAAAQMSSEPQPLAVMEEQSHLSTKKPTSQVTVSKVAVNTGFKDKAWLMAQPSGHYVLQLAQLSSEASVMRYIKQMGLEGKANYYHAHTNAGRVFVVLYSESFPGLQAAKKIVRQSFSAELQKSVWYRSYKTLQTSYRAP
ncbi:MAG: SPOR domain-containing protein [Amphritea sp.]